MKPFRQAAVARLSNPTKNKSAIIAGAGAVENAWDPILKALQPYHDFPVTPDGANSFLARLVYLLRFYATSPSDDAKTHLREHLDFLKEVKIRIAEELRLAEKKRTIRQRPSLQSLFERLVLPHGLSFMLVTTNWDTVIPKAVKSMLNSDFMGHVRPLHIHGSVLKISTMYLPSEVTKEPYRSARDDKEIGALHGAIWRGLEQVQRVVLYGISIDPLDAELGQTLAAGWSNPNLKEIMIVDPNHEKIAHRVNLLLDRQRDVKVFGLNSGTLNQEADYTIWRHRDNVG